MNFFKKIFSREKTEELEKGIEKTKDSFFDRINKAVAGKSKVDISFLDQLEEILIASDVGLETTVKIIERLEKRVERDKYLNTEELNTILKEEILALIQFTDQSSFEDFNVPPQHRPYVILVVGVNGVGKTTTIGKMAHKFTQNGLSVVIGAGDTFRAAAVDQLKIWSQRVGCHFYDKGMNADPSAVAYETVTYAKENKIDVAIIDTAGRLHTKINLMHELTKIKKSATKALEGAPHDVMLILDASTGQNAIEQAKQFTEATEVSCLTLTKLDGTAKGGVAIGISDQFKVPIRYIGVGEGIEQLQVFNGYHFISTMLDKKST